MGDLIDFNKRKRARRGSGGGPDLLMVPRRTRYTRPREEEQAFKTIGEISYALIRKLTE